MNNFRCFVSLFKPYSMVLVSLQTLQTLHAIDTIFSWVPRNVGSLQLPEKIHIELTENSAQQMSTESLTINISKDTDKSLEAIKANLNNWPMKNFEK